MARPKSSKIVRLPVAFHINIYVVVLLFIFMYVVFHMYELATKEHISIYEVTEKQIADDNTVNGLILREESIINSTSAGYLNYYVAEGEKIGKNTTVYSVDETGNIADALAQMDTDASLTADDTEKIRNAIAKYNKSYQTSNYREVYDFKYDIENTLLELTNTKLASSLTKVLDSAQGNTSFSVVHADTTGVISYSMDGFESMTIEDIDAGLFENPTVERKQLRSTEPIGEGTPVYKVITSDNWSIIVPLTEEQYKKVAEETSITIRFKKDNTKATVAIDTFRRGKQTYAALSLDRYMIQYLNERYIEIELLLNTAQGLKIPVSSIVKKKFFKVPVECFHEGGENSESGLTTRTYTENGETKNTFVAAPIYYVDKHDMAYVDMVSFQAGDLIEYPETGETYTISETGTLEGVYNVNKGYCEFRRIEKIYSNTEYYIISKDTEYGLSIYDHIVNNPDCINENDIIY